MPDASASLPQAPSSLDAQPAASDDLAAAAQVIRLYYQRIGARDYAGAWRLWWADGAASGTSEEAFARGFADTEETYVTILGPGAAEGAAGSIYATIPVRIDARLASGDAQHFAGRYVLRRVNDVPGSSADERRWHISSASLKSVAADTKRAEAEPRPFVSVTRRVRRS